MTRILFDRVTCLPGPVPRMVESVDMENGRLTALATRPAGAAEVPEAMLSPGLIDVHTHGIERSSYDQGAEALDAAVRALPRYGVTCVYPTLVPKMPAAGDVLQRIAALAAALPSLPPGAHCAGLHLEGPFVALSGAGCATVAGDVGLLDELLAAGAGRVRIMSIAPDVPGILPVIERLVEQGVVPFVTHTRATIEQSIAAVEAGARHATHFYDVFPLPEPTEGGVRPVGVVETFLADERCTVDFIVDGVHVHPMAIRAALAAKGPRGVLLVTDSNVGAGLPPGDYPTPWGYPVRVGPRGGARVADPENPKFGGLAGSCLTMDQGVQNLAEWFSLSLAQALAMGAANPARLMRLNKGVLESSRDADMVLWGRRGTRWQPEKTWVAGRPVWEAEGGHGG